VPDDIPLAAPARRLTVTSRVSRREDAWATGPGRWDAYYAIVFAVVLVVVWVGTDPRQRLIAIAAMAAMIPCYLLVGRPVWAGCRGPAWRGAAYVIAMILLFAAAQSQDPNAWFLAFVICPQFFTVIGLRMAMAASVALNLLAGLLLVYRVHSMAVAATSLAIAAAGLGFSIAYGGWVSRIIEQSAARAGIIEQLEATRAELAAVHHEAGVLAERQRLAGDIHDTIAQGFTSIVMLIQAAEAEIDADPAEARRHLGLAAETARENLAEARALVAALAPAQLEGEKLEDVLRRLAGQTAEQLSLAADFTVVGVPRPLGVGAEVILLRVCQEALANVRKHARARRAGVRLSYRPASVRLEVEDDGAGFDPAAVNGGYGLRGIRARVGEVGGSLALRSAPGEGTMLSIEVPA
jgi:signal transduction histidine kinase